MKGNTDYSKLKFLDCTLRDGGYYNNWKFKIKDANKYLKQIYRAGVDVVEVGFYFFDKNSKYGKFAYANKELAKKLVKSNKTKLAIMINGSDFFKIKAPIKPIIVVNKVQIILEEVLFHVSNSLILAYNP